MYNYEDFKNHYMQLNGKIDPSIPVGSDEYKKLTTKVRQGIAYFRLDKREAPVYNKDKLLKIMNQNERSLATEYSEFGHLKNHIDSNIKTNYLDAVNSKLSTTDLMRANPTIAAEKAMISALDQSSTNFKTISSNNSKANFGVDGFTRMNPRTSASNSRKRAINKIKGRDFKSKLASYEAVNGRIPRSTDLFKPYNGPSHLLNHKNTPNTTRITEAINTFNKIQSASVISKRMASEGKGFQPSGANFPDTKGYNRKQIDDNQKTQDLNAAKHNAAINSTLGHTFGKNPADLNKVSTNSNFLNSNGYKDTSYFSSYSDTTKVAIRANNDRLTGAYNKAVDDNGVGSRYKKALSSSDIQSKLDNYSKTKAGQSNLDRATQRRQQLEQANKNRLMRNSARFNRELISEKFKETAKNSYLNPASKIGGYVRELAENLPNHYADSLTALYHGVEVRETKSSLIDHYTKKLVDTFNPSESHITESNKKYAEGTLKQYEGVNRITGQGMNIDGLSKMSPSQLEYWKDIQRNITQNSLTNRVKGHNIDPFDNMTQDKEGNYRPNPHTSSVPTLDGDGKVIGFQDSPERSNFLKQIDDHKKEVSWIDGRLADLNNQSSNSIISERGTSTNRYSSFFGATDREQMNRVEFEELTSRRAEIQDRLNGYNMGYTGEHINSDFTGPMREGEARPIIPATSTRPAHTFDSYRPVFGTGYGLGFKGSMAASGGEHLARFAYFATPFGTGSGRQALMEAAGVMNKAQRFQATQARGFAKLGYAAVPISALGMTLMDMHQDKEVSEIAGNIFSMGTALHGWRMGASLGGAAGSMFGQVGKLIGLGLGGVGGLVGGLMIGQAVVDGISDAMSNDSKIRSFAKKAGTKEMYANTPETRQTLTARGAALQKLAKSGLNDRGLLLGNEATVLQGGM